MCVFCKIAAHEIPASIIYEDDTVIAFLDISQVTRGHTLVVSKQHYATIYDVNDETLAHMMVVAKHVSLMIKESFKAAGVNIIINTGTVAGQSVEHVHIHIIPRYGANDAFVCEFKESGIDVNEVAATPAIATIGTLSK